MNYLLSYLRHLIRFVTTPFRLLFYWPMKVIGAPRRLVGMSLPLRVAVLLAIFLVLLTITAYVAFFVSKDRSHWYEWTRPVRIVVLVSLLVAIPLVTYQALKLWLEGESSRYPEIDRAWREGILALEQKGLDLSQIPLFLVLGARDGKHADEIIAAAGFDLAVTSVPEGQAPLRWYASDRAIFLACTGTGCLGRLNARGFGQPSSGESADASPSPGITGTLVAAAPTYDEDAPPESADSADPPADVHTSVWGTLVAGVRGTLIPGEGDRRGPTAAASSATSRMPRGEVEQQSEYLRYICDLLRKMRQPLCPLNGVMTLLPWDVVQNVVAAQDMPGAIGRDLTTVRESTKLCCPVTAVVTGMEAESGFSELVRRVGAKRSKANRFGKGFDVWNPPTAENLDALASHACGAFEDWVYNLFREQDALSKPGNAKLYTLLCKIRSQLATRLKNILVRGYSVDAGEGNGDRRPQLFGGCYFAATGASEDRQAFARSAIDKMVQLEEELEWTDKAMAEDQRYQRLAQAGMVLNGLLFLALVGMLVYRYYAP